MKKNNNLCDYSKTELLVLIDSMKKKHDELKTEIISHVDEIIKIEEIINNKIKDIDSVENNYMKLMEEYIDRK